MEPKIEPLRMRIKKAKAGKLIESHWTDKLTMILVGVWESVQRAKLHFEITDTRPRWKTVLNRILRFTEALVLIVAGFQMKKFPDLFKF